LGEDKFGEMLLCESATFADRWAGRAVCALGDGGLVGFEFFGGRGGDRGNSIVEGLEFCGFEPCFLSGSDVFAVGEGAVEDDG
jgi:hypothetical protein